MTVPATINAPALDLSAAVAQASGESEAVMALRQAALARLQQQGLPTRKWEMWRFTDVSALQREGWDFTPASASAAVDAAELPPAAAVDAQRVVLVNGRFYPALSQLEAVAESGVVVLPLSQALAQDPEGVLRHLQRSTGHEEYPFAALNGALMQDGLFIHVPANVELEQPIHLIHYASGEGVSCYPRHLIVVEDNAKAMVVEDYCGRGRYLTCPVTELVVGNNGHLQLHKIQEEADQAYHLGAIALEQGRDAQVHLHLVNANGQLNRTDVVARLAGEGGHCGLKGLTLVRDKQVGDYHLKIVHAVPHCTSNQVFKNVLDDQGRSVFDGMIHVLPDAQKTDAIQDSRNLLLSRQAQAHANPRLEIHADDVRCTHGSTTGFLDQDALFYLRSRGIAEKDALAMLVFAFANECLEAIELEPLRSRLEQTLMRRLYPEGLENGQ